MQRKLNYLYASLRAVLTLAMANTGLRVYADNNGKADAEDAWPALRALGRDITVQRAGAWTATPAGHAHTNPEPEEALTLRHALELALRHNPELEASSHAVGTAEDEARQEGRLANPELEVEASEFGGTGGREGYDGAETTIRLSQPLELGGRRGTRQRMAQSEARLSGWDHEAQRMDVLTLTTKAFTEVLLAQGQVALADSLLALTEDVRKAAAERVNAGKVPPLEETKAGVEVAMARIGRERARRELDTARKRLAASWGSTAPAFREAVGDLEIIVEVPPLETLSALLKDAPEVARQAEEVANARHALDLARSARLPELVISAGVTRFEDDRSHAGIVGLSLPVPLFDRKAAAISAAARRVARAECEQRAARLRAATELAEAHNRLETARVEAMALKTDLLPAARQAFAAAQAGYREGKLGHLDVLDTQRTLGEAQSRYLDVLAACRNAIADVERLTGTPLNTMHPATEGGQR